MSLQEGEAKEIEPQLRALTFSGYFDRGSRFTSLSIIDINNGQFVGTITDDLGIADILGEKSDLKLHFQKLYKDGEINPYPINYQYERTGQNDWEGHYTFGPVQGHTIVRSEQTPLGENHTSAESYKKKLEEVSKLITDRQKEVVEREGDEEGEGYYEPGNPRTVGLPSRPVTNEDLQNFFEKYSSPEAIRRLSEGRDPGIKAIFNVFNRDALLSSFPDILDAIDFLGEIFPKFVEEIKGERISEDQQILFPSFVPIQKVNLLSEFNKDKSNFAVKLLSNLLLRPEGVVTGGLETQYIFASERKKEVSYEYIGEEIMKGLRKNFSEDKDPRTRAFFGWIGRHLMKKANPSTDFSLDRHNQMVEEDRTDLLQRLSQFKDLIEKGVEGELTREKAYEFFRGLSEFTNWGPGHFPNILTAETTLQWRLQQDFRKVCGLDDINEYMPYQEKERPGFDGNFAEFLDQWRSSPSENYGLNYREDYKRRFPEIFGDLNGTDEELKNLTDEILLQKWFSMLKFVLIETVEKTYNDIRDFVVTYFRFMEERAIAEGYAFAQKHISEIMNNLPQVVRLSEAEIKERFMQGMPPIFYDDEDDGNNRAEEWKDEPKDHWKWVRKSRIKGKPPDLKELDEIDD